MNYEPETRYAKNGDVYIAYQVVGDGPIDLVVATGFTHHLELTWENPASAAFFQRFASFARVIMFDKRGPSRLLGRRSQQQAAEMGDAAWRSRLDGFYDGVRRTLERYRGIEVNTTGDGFLARFDGPARAIRCAEEISSQSAQMGLRVRAGLHTGECELRGDDLGGLAVHIGARVADHADGDEVLVSSTVKDLVAGSGIHSRIAASTHSKACRIAGACIASRRRSRSRRQAATR